MQLAKRCVICGSWFDKSPSVSRANWPKVKCCSKACADEFKRGRPNPKVSAALHGKTLSPEHRAKLSATINRLHAEGKIRNARANLGLRREQTSQWKGDEIGYRAAHSRLHVERGRPSRCELCGVSDDRRYEWALSHDAEHVRAGDRGRPFSPRPDDYIRVCCRCHGEYDGRERGPNGQFL
jgi:hypothetical protein